MAALASDGIYIRGVLNRCQGCALCVRERLARVSAPVPGCTSRREGDRQGEAVWAIPPLAAALGTFSQRKKGDRQEGGEGGCLSLFQKGKCLSFFALTLLNRALEGPESASQRCAGGEIQRHSSQKRLARRRATGEIRHVSFSGCAKEERFTAVATAGEGEREPHDSLSFPLFYKAWRRES